MDVFKFGLHYYKRHLPLAFCALALGFIGILIMMLMPQVTQLIIDYVIVGSDPTVALSSADKNIFGFIVGGDYGARGTMQLMLSLGVLTILLLLIRHFSIYTRNNLYFVYGMKFEREMRQISFNKMMNTDSLVLSRYSAGDLFTIVANDPINFRNLYLTQIPNILDALFFIGLSVFFLFRIYPPLALLPIAVLPFQIVIFVRYVRRARGVNSRIRDSVSDLTRSVQENINGVRIVRSFAAEQHEIDKFKKRSSLFRERYFEQVNFSARYGLGFNAVRHVLYVACILAGALIIMNGTIQAGAFMAFISYVFSILDSTTTIVAQTFDIQQSIVCGERISTFVNTGNIIDDCEHPITYEGQPHIRLNNVSLSADDKTILKDIEIDLPYGKKVGIMGATASGKTSVLRLLTRLIDPVTGFLSVDGEDMRKYSLDSVRRMSSYVFQDVFLFSNTIDANIAFADPEISHEEVERCAKIAQAHSFISKMPDGYDTVVGERGLGLSGGQKQRVSVARALLKNAPVLLLDDVTSALDSETETALLSAVFNEYKERTVVITAHRASSVKDCDEIIYLEDGAIAERGTHNELMRMNGRYADVFNAQSADRLAGT